MGVVPTGDFLGDFMTSEREKRRIAREGAQKLKNQAGWDTSKFKAKDPMEKLQELVAKEAAEGMAKAGEECEDCRKTREELNDETALCQTHLAKAMGF
jgi:hypothetical protein